MSKRPSWLSAREAAAYLDVKLATLYAYKSRGLVESIPGPQGRGRRYARESLDQLKARHDARAGHAAVAAGALRFGEPSLETSVSEIRADGPYYRGHSAVGLCEEGASFEHIFDLLLTGRRDSADWSRASKSKLLAAPDPRLRASLKALCAARAAALEAPASLRAMPVSAFLAALVSTAALADPERHGAAEEQEHARARGLTCALAALLGGEPAAVSGEASVAERVLVALGQRPSTLAIETLDRALGLCADHELNASTFAARVTASTGADLYACLSSALHTLSGRRHGEASVRVEALLREIGVPARAAEVVRERSARGERVPGYGQPLYPGGDPRASALIRLAERAQAGARRRKPAGDYALIMALNEAMQRAGHPGPNLDAGLVAVSSALGLREGAGATVFAIGRMPGWVAHALEQRRMPFILRPRARYVPGPSPS